MTVKKSCATLGLVLAGLAEFQRPAVFCLTTSTGIEVTALATL